MSDQAKVNIWNCWTRNRRAKGAYDGYITHGFEEIEGQGTSRRTLCGVEWNDTGLVMLGEGGWKPSCTKCRKALVKRGLLIAAPAPGDGSSHTPSHTKQPKE